MSKQEQLRAVFAAGLLVFFVFTSSASAEATTDELLKIVPAKSMFCGPALR